jgi:threonine dehydrogenase-like Zn-dependent dehydrogenase
MVAAYEVLYITPSVQNLIRENKSFRIDSEIQTGKKYGMQLLDDHLFRLWREGLVDVLSRNLDAAGAVETINAGIAIARPGGQIALIGIPSEAELPIDLHTAMSKELNLQTIRRSNHNNASAIALIKSGRIRDSFVTHRLPLEKTPAAFESLAAYDDGVGKIVIEIPE